MRQDSEATDAAGTLSRRGFLAGALAVSGLVVLEAGATSEAADSARYLRPAGHDRGRLPEAQLRARRDRGARRPDCCPRAFTSAHARGPRADEGALGDGRRSCGPAANRSLARRARRPADRGGLPAHGPPLRLPPGSPRADRVRTVRRAAGEARRGPHSRRPPDEHVGRLQLPLRSDLVRERRRAARRPHPALPRRPPRRTARLRRWASCGGSPTRATAPT